MQALTLTPLLFSYVHDMATFKSITQAVIYQGRPETEHSW